MIKFKNENYYFNLWIFHFLENTYVLYGLTVFNIGL